MKESFARALQAALLAGIALPCAAHAQAAPQSSKDTGSDEAANNGIADIVVTAERRSSRLQDVPITITAVTAKDFQARGVTDLFDVGKVTPSFNSNRVVGFGAPILRGIGTTDVTAGNEPSVATYVDGFYQGAAITAQIPFNNVDRIEVLKGPQGTLYGRNATGGLVSIITRKPQHEFAAEGSVGYDTYRAVTATGYVTGGLGESISADIAVAFRNQDKGFYRNLGSGGRLGTNDYIAVRSKLLFDFGGDNSLTLAGEYIDSKDSRANINIPFPGTTPLTTGPGIIYGTKPFEWAGSVRPRFNVRQYDFTSTLRLDAGFADFVSLTQYKNVFNSNAVEGDGTTADGLFVGTQLGVTPGLPANSPLTPQVVVPYSFSYIVNQRQPYFWTQELQLLSKDGGPFRWIVGGYFQSSKDDYKPLDIFYDVSNLANPFTRIVSGVTTKAYAVFAQGTYSFGGGLSLTAGGRYSSERKHVFGTTTVPAFALSIPGDQSRTFNSFTYRLSLDYRASEQLLLYAATNKGFKSGTFVGNSPTSPSVRPETLYAYEVGFKADPSPQVRINGAAYYYDYKDIQTFITAPNLASILQNAARAELYGAELSVELAPVEGLRLTGAIGYEHSRYKDFPGAAVYLPSPSGGNYPATVDATGHEVLRTPAVTANGSVSYEFAAGSAGTVNLAGSVSYTDRFYWDTANAFRQPGYALVDLSARFTSADRHWNVSVWGKNVTNKVYAIYRNPQQRYDAASFGDPATYGVTLGIRF